MDSQHRHELQQNELRKLTTKAAPFVEQYLWHIVGVAAVTLVVFFGLVIWFSETSATTTEGWAQFDRVLHESNPTAGDFDEVAEKHPSSPVAAWARLKEADDYLKSGLREAFTDRDVSQSEIKKGLEVYQKLIAGGPGILPEIRERALFGLARCQEATSDGNTEEALGSYQRLLKEFPDSCFQAIATERIKELETSQAKDFYAWFHELKPKPQEPVINPFRKRTDESDSAKESMPDDSATDEKPADQTASDARSEETPADEKPNGESKPESEKPAAEEPNKDKPASEEPKSETSETKPDEDAKKPESP